MATPIGFDPATYSADTAAPFTLGRRYTAADGREFRLIRNANTAGDNDLVLGDVAIWAATAVGGTTVNPGVVSDGLAGVGSSLPGNPPACVMVGALAKNKYGFGLTKGTQSTKSNGTTTSGQPQKISSTAGSCTDQTAVTIWPIGVALADDAGGFATVEVNL